MNRYLFICAGTVLLGVGGVVADGVLKSAQVCAAEEQVSFKGDIQPLLKWRCSGCHEGTGEGVQKSGLDLSNYAGLMKGTKFGRMVIPGDPESSNLMMLLDWRVAPAIRMPHGKKQLSSCDRDAIRTWIRQGAKDN
ncbi:MAG TPA: c-type cytochrome domain-containing protein [Pseudolabrys sp.]|jgi:hypothetical protein|uniref:c-type cytochrome domain-containing protein n=1 Tax=Pseudolabrys sp. TaxID=1960880 RepID=UPI002DDD9E5A|nr:c-type cytochrome domain-containing protein [Pseudolabrys sp.]HEV2628710.1 c-type cytochrome domain-containing protein [Pseudolabrys sp.]